MTATLTAQPPAAPTAALLYTTLESPIGPLTIVGDEHGLERITMHDQRYAPPRRPGSRRGDAALAGAREQLAQYFAGERRGFELPLRLGGSDFQRAAWAELERIPFGETTTYGRIARALGEPDAARAIGVACARNPFAIVVPCHRVVGADGRLVGYGGGLERKAWLLEHEARTLVRATR